nr:hypothetical protein [Tanacetum cinerariifolium]
PGCCVFVGESEESSRESWVRWRSGRKSGGSRVKLAGKLGYRNSGFQRGGKTGIKVASDDLLDTLYVLYLTSTRLSLKANDGEINLEHYKNLISNEFTVKLCLEHEVKNGDKVVKKELVAALREEINFINLIFNFEEDDTFINLRFSFDNDDGLMIRKYFIAYTQTDVQQFRVTLIQHMESIKKSIDERSQHKREYSRVNKSQMQSKKGKVDSSKELDASLAITECSRTKSDKQDTSSNSWNCIAHAVDADSKPVNDQVPFAEVQLTAHHNVLANEQQHYVQSEPIYDTHLLEKIDTHIY